MKVRDNPSDVLEHKGRERRYLQKNTKIITGSIVALAVIVVLGIVYAAFTQQLTINGSATGRSSSWKIYFSRLTGPTLNGTAKQITAPEIKNNSTTIGDYSVTVTSPGDYIEYEFDVTNDGDYDATLTGLTMKNNTELTYEGSGENEVNDENNVKSQIEYTLKYSDGTTVSQNDTLKSKETKTMRLRLTYKSFDDASLLPKADVAISGLGISLTYTQDGNAKVNNDGTTPYVAPQPVYAVGDRIQVAGDTTGDYYRVIAASGANQDYVVALKEEPLSVDEVNLYGGAGTENNHVNQYANSSQGIAYDYNDTNHTGGMAYYTSSTCGWVNDNDISDGCTKVYNSSEVKYVVNAWAQARFTQNQLKNVSDYEARLITIDEYIAIPSSESWRYNENYEYWTMTPSEYDEFYVQDVNWWGYLSANYVAYSTEFDDYLAVRPVINVYKSKISS